MGLGLTPPLPKKKKLVYNGLKWSKMDFKGMFFIFFNRIWPPLETPTKPFIENSIYFVLNPSLRRMIQLRQLLSLLRVSPKNQKINIREELYSHIKNIYTVFNGKINIREELYYYLYYMRKRDVFSPQQLLCCQVFSSHVKLGIICVHHY